MTSLLALRLTFVVVCVWMGMGVKSHILQDDPFQHNDVIDRKVKDKAVYLFGVGGTRKPYNFLDAGGKLVGFDVDIVNAVCAEANKDCHTVLRRKEDCIFTDRDIDYAGEGLMSEAVHGCGGYQITMDRLNEFSFTLPYLRGQSTYAVLPGNPATFNPDLNDFSKFRLVQASGSPFNAACLTREGKRFGSILVVETVSDAKMALSIGKADVLLSTRITIPGLDVLPAVVRCDGGRGTGMLLKQGSDVPRWWNPAFRHVYKSKAYYRLCKEAGNKYNATINCLPHPDEAEKTLMDTIYKEETKDVEQRQSRLWKFVVSGRIAPYSFLNTDGELTGFTKDFILNVCRIAGKKCSLLLSEVSECSVREGELLYPGRGLISGWFDACTGYFSTVDRRNSWDFTDPYLVSNASFYVAPGNPTNFDPTQDDLSSFTIGENCNSRSYITTVAITTTALTSPAYQATSITTDHCLHRLHKKVGKLLVVQDEEEAVKAVLSGKVNAWFTKLIVPSTQGLQRLPERFHCEHVGTSIMVRKGSELPSWWNEAFRKFVKTGGFHRFCQDQGKIYQTNFPCVPDPRNQ